MWGRDTGDVGTEEMGTQGRRIWDIMGTGDVGHGDREKWGRGGGGHRDTAADLPALTPDPQHHGCRGGDTDGAAGAEGDTATSGVGTAAVPPSVTRPLLGAPCFTFSSRGGCSAPLGGGNAPHPPSPSVPTGVVALEVAVPPRRGTWPHGGGGVVVPKSGGKGWGDSGFSVTPPPCPPPSTPHFGSLQAEAGKVSPQGGGGEVMVGGWGAHPKIEPSSHPKGTPPPTLCIGG